MAKDSNDIILMVVNTVTMTGSGVVTIQLQQVNPNDVEPGVGDATPGTVNVPFYNNAMSLNIPVADADGVFFPGKRFSLTLKAV